MKSYPDVKAEVNDWVDVYDVTGITVGTRLIIQNKSNQSILLYESDIKPPAEKYGRIVLPWEQCSKDVVVTQGSLGLWAKALGHDCFISVQEG